MVEMFRKNAKYLNEKLIGTTQLILVEDVTKRSQDDVFGRNDGNIKVILPKEFNTQNIHVGDYVAVEIQQANSQVLKGKPLDKVTLSEFYNQL